VGIVLEDGLTAVATVHDAINRAGRLSLMLAETGIESLRMKNKV
jgi:hypothetical protein